MTQFISARILLYFLFVLPQLAATKPFHETYNLPTFSMQIFLAGLFIVTCIGAYLYRMRGVNKRNKQLFDLNSRLILEVNDHKNTEKKLIASKQRFTQLSKATFEAIFITDQNKIEEVNQSAIDMFGYSHEELKNISVNQLIKAIDDDSVFDILIEESYPLRAIGIRKDNSELFIEFRSKTINYENREYKVFAIIDISEKVFADRQKEILEHQLRQAQKMEAVGNLAGGVAHDFNNMLQVIMGFSEMAIKKLDKDDMVFRDLSRIITTAEKAAHLTKQLMTLSRKHSYQPVVVSLNALITNLENILINLLGADIVIQKDLQQDIPRIFADPGQVEQVLVNLIVNARDAVNEKRNGAVKKIEIITRKIKEKNDQLLQHIDVTPVDHVCIEIRDNGCGMPEEIQQRVYEPFFTTKPEGKGTGLGLSTVYGIVKQNKAIIDLQSQLNNGTSFKIYWPSTDKSQPKQKKEKVHPDNSVGNEIILLVEDEEGIRNFAVSSLKHKGYKVHVAENGKKALMLIEEEDIQFDLLISDLNMPDMDGEELVRNLNKKFPDLRAIVMSGYGDEFLAKNKLVNGKIEFLQKPFSIKEMLFKVRTVLDRN